MFKTIVILSGGMDSATALWWVKQRNLVYALSFKFHGRNRNEIKAAKRLAKEARVVKHFIVDVGFLRQISELSELRKNPILEKLKIPTTYIPSRNMIFFGIASYFTEIIGAKYIFTGHSNTDPFLDAKPEYVKAINAALSHGSWLGRMHRARIVMPFAKMDKTGILKLALKLKVPLEYTWSCHREGKMACGVCEGCTSRLNAFKNLGRIDIIRYNNMPSGHR